MNWIVQKIVEADWLDFAGTVISVVVGGWITVSMSRWQTEKAAEHARKEAEANRRAIERQSAFNISSKFAEILANTGEMHAGLTKYLNNSDLSTTYLWQKVPPPERFEDKEVQFTLQELVLFDAMGEPSMMEKLVTIERTYNHLINLVRRFNRRREVATSVLLAENAERLSVDEIEQKIALGNIELKKLDPTLAFLEHTVNLLFESTRELLDFATPFTKELGTRLQAYFQDPKIFVAHLRNIG